MGAVVSTIKVQVAESVVLPEVSTALIFQVCWPSVKAEVAVMEMVVVEE